MSNKQTKAAINLGNETHARGFNDGLNGRPKTIKKSHAHAHRYHIGYRLGQAEAKTTMRAALSYSDAGVVTHNYQREAMVNPLVKVLTEQQSKPTGFWGKLKSWLVG